MTGTIHYQWQNEFLLKKIYPMREVKLRDFLTYYREVELWGEYKDTQPGDHPAEVQEYFATRREELEQVIQARQDGERYLLIEDVTPVYQQEMDLLGKPVDPGMAGEINRLHSLFIQNFHKLTSSQREKIFTANRVTEFEGLRLKMSKEIAQKQRILDDPNSMFVDREKFEQKFLFLKDVSFVMLESELGKLKAFQSALDRLDVYKQALVKQITRKKKELEQIETSLLPLVSRRQTLEKDLEKIERELKRLTDPPDLAGLQAYFTQAVLDADLLARFPGASPNVLQHIRNLHRDFKQFFPGFNNPVKEKHFTGQRILEFEDFLKILKAGDPSGQTAGWRLAQDEFNRLTDLLAALQQRDQPLQNTGALIEKKKAERQAAREKIEALRPEEERLRAVRQRIERELILPEKEQLLAMIDPSLLTIKDLARFKVEQYRKELDTRDHRELLEMIVQRFVSQPECYPLWLQYMVIHYSGMRYRSAHGSWADPRVILGSLVFREIDQEIQQLDQVPGGIKDLSEQKFARYKTLSSASGVAGLGNIAALGPNRLALAQDPVWKKKVEKHIQALDPATGSNKRRALLELRQDEETFRIQNQAADQVLGELTSYKEKVPGWAWKEIIRYTTLRITEVDTLDWEALPSNELALRNQPGAGKLRQMLDAWKFKNITAWREEHARVKRVIVSQAVCNEVAEHIQHVRGWAPSGGLTLKPMWYLGREKAAEQAGEPERAYFKKTTRFSDLRVGASIFWLRWVDKMPNDAQITRPMVLKDGGDIMPALRDAVYEITVEGNTYRRRVTTIEKDEHGNPVEQHKHQWLRWMHEAMVARIGESPDGPVVLTFETSLPNVDKALSTMGLDRRLALTLMYRVSPAVAEGTLTGYVAEAGRPFEDMRAMLDWNKILQREAFSPAQIEEYWSRVEAAVEGTDCARG